MSAPTSGADQASTTLNHLLGLQIKHWKQLAELATLQEKACRHWQRIWFGGTTPSNLFQLAPDFLQQTINPTSFSVFNLTSNTRSNPFTESHIVKYVAGYGSQLGTLMDALMAVIEALEKNKTLDANSPTKAVFRLKDLSEQIEAAKDRVF